MPVCIMKIYLIQKLGILASGEVVDSYPDFDSTFRNGEFKHLLRTVLWFCAVKVTDYMDVPMRAV